MEEIFIRLFVETLLPDNGIILKYLTAITEQSELSIPDIHVITADIFL